MKRRPLIATGVYPPDIGGPATYASALMRELPARGVEPTVMLFSSFMRYPRGLRHMLFTRRMIAARGDYDLLFALDPVSSGLPAYLASKRLGKPLLLRVGGDFAWEQATERFGVDVDLDHFLKSRWGPRIGLLVWLERFVARSAALVIAPNRYLANVLQRWGVEPERIVVVPNGVTPVEAAASREQARAALGVDGRLIVSMGRLMRFKGFGEVIQAFAALTQAFQDVGLHVIGSGPRRDELASRIGALNLKGRVQLTGPVPRAKSMMFLRAADVFVLNSATEGQSHTILEAMALGTPVVTTSVGGNLELIEHGRSGWLVAHDDRQALVEAMSALLGDKELAARIAAEAKRTVEPYSVERMVEGTLSALEGVM